MITQSLLGKHCVFEHDPTGSVRRIWATRRSDGQIRHHKWFNTEAENQQKCDFIQQMPGDTGWSVREYDLSQEVLTGVAQAQALGVKHAGLHAAFLQDAVKQGVDPRHVWSEGRNEPQPGEMPFLCAYEIARMDESVRLGTQIFGDPKAVQLVLFNIPEGNPGTLDGSAQAACNWDMLLDARNHALAISPDGDLQILYGYHAYFGWDGPNALWDGGDMKLYAIPYRISHCWWPERKWLFTEGGCDDGVNGNAKESWRSLPQSILASFKLPASDAGLAQWYHDQLVWLDQIFILDGRIVGWTLFTDDFNDRMWWKFDTNVPALDAVMDPYYTRPVNIAVWGDLTVARWQPLIEHRAAQFGLDPHLVAAIVRHESAGIVNADGGAGDTGLMQVIDGEHMGGRPAHAVLLNPDQNVKAGCSILAGCWATFGDWAHAVAAYNCGVAAIQEYGITGPLASEYLADVSACWNALWPGLPNPLTGAAPQPAPAPSPVSPPVSPPAPVPAPVVILLPQQEPATDAATLADKCRWWTEEFARQQAAGNKARAAAILDGLINVTYGLMYRLQKVLGQ